MRIEVSNVSRTFGSLKAVDNISFSFGSGEVFGFIGPNGAGKTTTLRMLATMDPPDSGDIFYDGRSALNYPDAIRRLTGFMPDSLDEHHDMTVAEYVDFFARAAGLRGRARASRCAAVRDFTGLDPLADKRTDSLSKGMKQRLSLARALICDPQVLLLDEPASGLDPRARVELRELVKILSEQGKAVLVSSHILTELSEICNGVVIIERGRILAEGRTCDIEKRLRPHEVVSVRLAEPGRLDALEKFLLEQPAVSNVVHASGALRFDLAGAAIERSEMLARMVATGFKVCHFTAEAANLEDLFLQITKGEVS